MHGLAKFAVVKKSCLGCKNLLPNQDDNLCVRCLPQIKSIYIERKNEQLILEKKYADLWVMCQRC